MNGIRKSTVQEERHLGQVCKNWMNLFLHLHLKHYFWCRQILMVWSKVVTPAKTGVQYFCNTLKFMDSGVHRNDVFWAFSTFDQIINIRLAIFM
jgi:hypothetical protein